MKRRDLLAMATVGSGLTLAFGWRSLSAQGRARVLTFVPSDEKSRTIEKRLAGALNGLDVTVFGRAKDLERSVEQMSPEAVIAPEPTLRDLGLTPTMSGKRGGSTTEPYVLVTVERAAAPSSMAGATVGVLGIMGHASMEAHCGQLLGTGRQKIKTVTKYADLLPLLQFKVAQGVVLPLRFAQALTSRSALTLVQNEIPGGRVGLTAVAIQSPSARDTVISALLGMSGDGKSALGVEGWQ